MYCSAKVRTKVNRVHLVNIATLLTEAFRQLCINLDVICLSKLHVLFLDVKKFKLKNISLRLYDLNCV